MFVQLYNECLFQIIYHGLLKQLLKMKMLNSLLMTFSASNWAILK